MERQYLEIDLRELFRQFRRKWWLIILIVLTSSFVSYYLTNQYVEPVYEAKTSLFIGKEGNDLGISLSELQTYNQLIIDYAELAKSRLVIEPIIKQLDLMISVEGFQQSLAVNTIEDSRLFTVRFRHTDPEIATQVANALAKELQLKATEIVEVENIRVIDKALVPRFPIRPNIVLNTIIGGCLGFIIGFFAIFLQELFNNTIKNEDDVTRVLGINTIGLIPHYKGGSFR